MQIDYNVYFRNENGSLGRIVASNYEAFEHPHKEAILTAKEHMVEQGDCLDNKAVLAVIEGGKK